MAGVAVAAVVMYGRLSIILQSMVVLALDTSTTGGSCAVTRDGVILRESQGDPARPHDTRLPGELQALLDDARIPLQEVDVYAVATGPGSFTGVRIGIATMQGLAFAMGKPLIGVSTFDALARAVQRAPHTRLATWIDAWRGEVYAAVYEEEQIEEPAVVAPAVLLARLRGTPTVFAGDAANLYRADILATMGPHARIADPALPLLAGTVAAIATEQAGAGHQPPPHAVRPLYIRRPDVELTRDARSVR
jgi:tRNA threonylcarbamoyladenosine biosynthesis protein TsaB